MSSLVKVLFCATALAQGIRMEVPEPEGMVHLMPNCVSSQKTLDIRIPKDSTARDLKTAIAEKESIREDQQIILIFAGKKMADEVGVAWISEENNAGRKYLICSK